ncbi:MAG: O-antigen ligase family protein [Dehalococcoidia bacterium]
MNTTFLRSPRPPSLARIAGVSLAGILVISITFLALGRPVLAIGITLAFVAAFYLLFRPTYSRAFHLMILSLPFLAAFVIDIGGNLRVPYYFAVIALGLGLYHSQLDVPRQTLTLWFLGAFAIYALLSIALTFQFAPPSAVENFGFRTSQFRPLIQAGQLGLMLIFFYLTLNFIRSGEQLKLVSKLIIWSLALVVAYGTYEVICTLTECSFINVNTNPDHIENRFAGTQKLLSGEITIPRPRSILLEPLNLGIYILFSLPFAVAYLAYAKSGIVRWTILGIIALAGILFLLTWSRGAFIGMLLALAVALLLVSNLRTRLLILVGCGVAYLAIALIVFPLLGSDSSIKAPAAMMYERLYTVVELPTAIINGNELSSNIGRPYNIPVSIFRDHATLGVGLGNYPIALSEMTGVPLAASAPFSLHLEILTQFGIIGATFFYLFLGYVMYQLFRATRNTQHPLRPFAVASLISIIGVMTASAALGGLTTDGHLWVMLAIAVVIPTLMRDSVPSIDPASEESQC